MNKQLPTSKAFKRSPSLEISTWYKGILTTQLAGEADTGGALRLVSCDGTVVILFPFPRAARQESGRWKGIVAKIRL